MKTENVKICDCRECTVRLEFLWDLFLRQDRKCALSGLPISLEKRRITASLDRIDSKGGYTPGNVQWLHKDVNRMKLGLNQAHFLSLVRSIAVAQKMVDYTSFPVDTESHSFMLPMQTVYNNSSKPPGDVPVA